MKFVQKTDCNKHLAIMVALGLTAIVPVKAYPAMLMSSKCPSQSSKTLASDGSGSDSQQGIKNYSLEQPSAGQASQTQASGSGQSNTQACSNSPAKTAQP